VNNWHFSHYYFERGDTEVRFHIRGDASFALELVQQSLLTQFQQAYETVIDSADSSSGEHYPVLTGSEFDQYVGIQTAHRISGIMTGSHNNDLNEHFLAYDAMEEFPQLTVAHIEKMMRRISRRAGVVRLSNEVYELAWERAIATILAIVTPACNKSIKPHAYRRECNKKTALEPHQSIHDVALFPYDSIDDDGDDVLNFVLVPKQLE
jgi:hypothetical protein